MTGGDHQPVLVDQPQRRQLVHEVAAAIDQQVPAILGLEGAHTVTEIVLQQCRVPFGRGQAARGDVLGHRVHLAAEVAAALLHLRPRGGEALVGDAAEQQGVAALQVVVLHLRQVLAVLAPEQARPGRVLDHAVE